MRRSLLIGGTVLVLALAACSGDDGGSEPSPKPDDTGSAASEVPQIEVEAGSYGYDAYGVEAVLTPKGGGWTLKIANDSGTKLDAPGLYALDARTGEQFDATVEGAKAMSDGASETLEVTWPAEFDQQQIGMVILTVGDDNYGAFFQG